MFSSKLYAFWFNTHLEHWKKTYPDAKWFASSFLHHGYGVGQCSSILSAWNWYCFTEKQPLNDNQTSFLAWIIDKSSVQIYFHPIQAYVLVSPPWGKHGSTAETTPIKYTYINLFFLITLKVLFSLRTLEAVMIG